MLDGPRVFHLDVPAVRLVERVRRMQRASGLRSPGVNQWLAASLRMFGERLGDMAELEPAVLGIRLREALERRRDAGAPIEEEAVLKSAERWAASRGRRVARAEDIAAAALSLAGYRMRREAAEDGGGGFAELLARPSGYEPSLPAPHSSIDPADSVLRRFGRDLTAEARAGALPPIVGREAELETVIEVLCRTTKRNPVLVGAPGVGKTAVAEALAARLAVGDVPRPLAGHRLVSVQPSVLASGASSHGELQARVERLIAEASSTRVILFLDEVHSLVGMAGDAGANDLAAMVKPALSRGEIACVAATTDAEYRRFIESDGALERRFQPVRVDELDADSTLTLLATRRDHIAEVRRVEVGDDVLRWLVEFGAGHMRSRYFPDKAIDLLEQCVANAAASGVSEVDMPTAVRVAERLVGLPGNIEDGVAEMRREIERRGLLASADLDALVSHLHVRMRGFGSRAEQPNAVVALLDRAADAVDLLAETIAGRLFGAATRQLVIDCGRLTDAHSATLLLGSPPSYIGYNESLPIHKLLQAPWSVLRLENVGAAHPRIVGLLAQALRDGYFTDGAGRRIYVSDAVVLITAHSPKTRETAVPARARAASLLGPELERLADVVTDSLPAEGVGLRRWLERDLIEELSERLASAGLDVRWDGSVAGWLAAQQAGYPRRDDWQRLVETRVAPQLLAHLPEAGERKTVAVSLDGERLSVHPQ